jgi:ribosomal protein L27
MAHAASLQWHSGTNTDLGKDYTLFSLMDGIVMYEKKKEHHKERSKVGPQLI